MGAGVILRAGLGAVLFWISYLKLGVLPHLQAGGGFWELAPDARSYFRLAASAAEHGFDSIYFGAPSPMFIRALASWMWLVGVSPASAVLFNTLIFAISAAVIVWGVRSLGETVRAPVLMALAAYSLSPAAVLFSTQALKDQLFSGMIALAAVGALQWTSPGDTRRGQSPQVQWLGFALLLVAIYFLAGIRAYYAVFVIAAVLAAHVYVVWKLPTNRWPLALVKLSVCVVLLWFVFKMGAAEYYPYYDAHVRGAINVVFPQLGLDATGTNPISALENARAGFAGSGGATNIGPSFSPGESAFGVGGDAGSIAVPPRGFFLARIAQGLTVLFVPVSLLQYFNIVDFAGGRGLLLVTDIDTLFIDVTLLAIAGFCIANRKAVRWHIPYCVLVILLTVLSAVSIAYVVTNYGTMFRLRLLVTVPAWLFVLGVARHDAAPVSA